MLQKTARPQIAWHTDIPERGRGALRPADAAPGADQPAANAADAVAMRPRGEEERGRPAGSRSRSRSVGDEIRLSVTDDGVGLPEQDRARLTEPYVTHKPKGTGLGLRS